MKVWLEIEPKTLKVIRDGDSIVEAVELRVDFQRLSSAMREENEKDWRKEKKKNRGTMDFLDRKCSDYNMRIWIIVFKSSLNVLDTSRYIYSR